MDFTKLNELLSSLPGYDLLTDTMKTSALQGALIPDEHGVWPGQQGYDPTYDVYYAAAHLVPVLQAQPSVTNVNSEGTGVTVTPPDWGALLSFYRSMSPIHQGYGHDVLRVVPIPDPPHVQRVPMNDRGGYYGDVDTDVG